MRWRLIGLVAEFAKNQTDGSWNRFMQDRPEIQLALVPVLEKVARKAAADGPAPKVLGIWQPDREYKETMSPTCTPARRPSSRGASWSTTRSSPPPGWDYPIAITFTADGYSTWRVNGGVAAHERGWPPVTGVPKAGFRG